MTKPTILESLRAKGRPGKGCPICTHHADLNEQIDEAYKAIRAGTTPGVVGFRTLHREINARMLARWGEQGQEGQPPATGYKITRHSLARHLRECRGFQNASS